MLQAVLKQCSSMQTAYRVRVVRRTYGEHEQIMRGRRRRGRSAVQSLMAKLSLALAKRVERIAHCRGIRRNDLELILILSHHPVSSH